jgi:two-component system NtrC family response regulator
MPDAKPALLVVEDDEGLRRQYRWSLPDCRVLPASTRLEALELFRRERPPVAIVDLGLPPDPDGASEGLATLEGILSIAPDTKVIIVSGNELRENAMRAVGAGAYDFCQKPVEIDTLALIVKRAVQLHALEAENRELTRLKAVSPVDGIVGSSPQILQVLRSVERISPTDVSVLLLGESGTGKELLAQAIHRLSPRAAKPFIAINCSAIPETLLESELFGHEKGAFTGAVKQTIGKMEQAHLGTLFLDEIGDVPLAMQVKLLRFLQNQVIERVGGRSEINVDARIVCATNQGLDALMKEGRFREDLYFRLNEITIKVPPLREREGDAVVLANFFLRKFNTQFNRRVKGFTADAVAAISTHPWRGNVRELENRIKRASVMAEGPLVTAADLDFTGAPAAPSLLSLRDARHRAERDAVQLALAQAAGNMSQAARLLGISRPTLYDLVEEHKIVVGSNGLSVK